jgi:hypothetical protein
MARSARKLGVKCALPEGFPFASIHACRAFYWLDGSSPEAAIPVWRKAHAKLARRLPPGLARRLAEETEALVES